MVPARCGECSVPFWVLLSALRLALLVAARVSVFAVCATESAAVALFAFINMWIVKRVIGLPSRELWRAVLRPLPATVVLVLAALAGRFAGRQCCAEPGIGLLALSVLPALLAYGAVTLIRSPHLVDEVRDMAAVALSRRDGACQ